MRIVFYYIPRNLGHTKIVFTLVKNIKLLLKDKVSITVFQVDNEKPWLPFKKYSDVCVLPVNVSSKTDAVSTSGKRIKKAIRKLKEFVPDVFVSEFYPFGRNLWSGEVEYILKYLKGNSNARIFSSISYFMWAGNALDKLIKYYDGILCHFPYSGFKHYLSSPEASFQGKTLFREIRRTFKNRIYFTEFISEGMPCEDKTAEIVKSVSRKNTAYFLKDNFILVSRGGGEKEKCDIIAYSLSAAKRLKDQNFLIVTGPYIEDKLFLKYKNISKNIKNVRVVKYLKNFDEYLKNCRLSINAAGYNTCVSLLGLRKKFIVLPYDREEQRVLALFLKKKYKITSVFPEELNTDKLVKEILRNIKGKQSARKVDSALNGISNTVSVLFNK